jgi:hypothetical protein
MPRGVGGRAIHPSQLRRFEEKLRAGICSEETTKGISHPSTLYESSNTCNQTVDA